MSVNSTMYITRRQLKRKIKDKLKTLSDRELAEVGYDLVGRDARNNYRIVSQEQLDERNAEENRIYASLGGTEPHEPTE